MTVESGLPANWSIRKLPDLLFFQEGPGVRNWQFTEHGVKLLNVRNINFGKINLDATSVHISHEEAHGKYSHFLVDEGDLVIASSGIVVDNFHNKIAFVLKEHLPLCMNTSTIRFKPLDTSLIDIRFFKIFLGTSNFKSQLRRLITGSAQLNFGPSHLRKIEIPLPPLDDQIRIAHLLGKVEGLIANRKQHLQQLDDLLKSVFLEMFDPQALGYADWPLVQIKDLAANHKGAMRTGPFGSNLLHSEFSANGDVAVLGIDSAVQNRFKWDERRFISNEKYKELQSYRIFPGDVIVTIMGTIGRSAVVPHDIPLAINTKHLAAITLNTQLANPLFLSYSIYSSPFILNQFRSKNKGAIMSGLNLGLIKETKLKRPPIELQNKFAETHTRVDTLKAM